MKGAIILGGIPVEETGAIAVVFWESERERRGRGRVSSDNRKGSLSAAEGEGKGHTHDGSCCSR